MLFPYGTHTTSWICIDSAHIFTHNVGRRFCLAGKGVTSVLMETLLLYVVSRTDRTVRSSQSTTIACLPPCWSGRQDARKTQSPANLVTTSSNSPAFTDNTSTAFLSMCTMRRGTLLLFSISLSIFIHFAVTSARQFNVTIDDQEGDPTNGNQIIYTPDGAWNIGQNCSKCVAKPTPKSDAYLGTWMDSTFLATGKSAFVGQVLQASISFVGTSLPANCRNTCQ